MFVTRVSRQLNPNDFRSSNAFRNTLLGSKLMHSGSTINSKPEGKSRPMTRMSDIIDEYEPSPTPDLHKPLNSTTRPETTIIRAESTTYNFHL